MWTWDADNITHDQVCWTYDSYDGCNIVPVGGGGGGTVSGESYFNQTPSVNTDKKKLFLQQAIEEDDELIMILKTIVGIIQ